MKQAEIKIILNKIGTDARFASLNTVKNLALTPNKNLLSKKIMELYDNKYKNLNFNFSSKKQAELLLIMIVIDLYLMKIDNVNDRYTKNIKNMLNKVSFNLKNISNVPKKILDEYLNKIKKLDLKLYNINQL